MPNGKKTMSPVQVALGVLILSPPAQEAYCRESYGAPPGATGVTPYTLESNVKTSASTLR